MSAIKYNGSMSTHLRMALMADPTSPVEHVTLPCFDIHALCDRIDLFTVFMMVDDLVLLLQNTRERVLKTRCVP